jgi:hypothetical protein
MQKFLIYLSILFSSALHVSGFLLVHLQRQVYNFDSGPSLLGMVLSARVLTPYVGDLNHCRSCASEDGLKQSPKHVRQNK